MNLGDIADHINGVLFADPTLEVTNISDLSAATDQDLTFVLSAKQLPLVKKNKGLAYIVYKKIKGLKHQIVVEQPRKALAQVISMFTSNLRVSEEKPIISSTADLASSSIIGNNTTISDNVCLKHHVVIGQNCYIGEGTVIFPNVTIYDNTIIGKNCIIHAGSCIGSDGFGYYHDQEKLFKIPHIGSVILEDDVEIGVNVAIDRGCLGKTRVGKGTKIDNLVHIAHNSLIGSHCAIAAQVGVTGSSKVGNYVMIGGQVGIDAASVGNAVVIAGKAGVTKDIAPNQTVSGFPARNHMQQMKYEAVLRQLVKKRRLK